MVSLHIDKPTIRYSTISLWTFWDFPDLGTLQKTSEVPPADPFVPQHRGAGAWGSLSPKGEWQHPRCWRIQAWDAGDFGTDPITDSCQPWQSKLCSIRWRRRGVEVEGSWLHTLNSTSTFFYIYLTQTSTGLTSEHQQPHDWSCILHTFTRLLLLDMVRPEPLPMKWASPLHIGLSKGCITIHVTCIYI